jgi:hypothetical protein
MGDGAEGWVKVRPVRSNLRGGFGAFVAVTLATAVAGCSFNTKHPETPAVDPNLYPQNYRKDVAIFLSQQLLDRADFRGARIAPPVLKPVGGDNPHYVVCLVFNGHSEIKNKMALFLGGEITQFVDSAPEQCGDAVYQPFTELEQAMPGK